MDCSDRAGLCYVYRTLAEIWIQDEKKPKAIRLLCSLVDESIDPLADSPLEESKVEDCVEKFEEINRKILQDQTVRDKKAIVLIENLIEYLLGKFSKNNCLTIF
jgi:hypothetical protein